MRSASANRAERVIILGNERAKGARSEEDRPGPGECCRKAGMLASSFLHADPRVRGRVGYWASEDRAPR